MIRFLAATACTALLLAAGAALPIQPGKWSTTATIIDMRIPGMPAGMAKMALGHPTTVASCVTPQQAADGPKSVMQASNGRCRYTAFDMSKGRFNATMVCTGGAKVTGTGSYTATSMDVTSTSVTPEGGSVRMHVVGKRVGACG